MASQLKITLPRTQGRRPLTAQICDAVKAHLAVRSAGAGEQLPSTRALALELGVSRTTVTAAYEQLLAEGYLKTRPGARALVAATPAIAQRLRSTRAAAAVVPARLSQLGHRVVEQAGHTAKAAYAAKASKTAVLDFRYGDLATSDFPTLAWRRLMTAALLRRQPRLRYSDAAGLPALRSALQGYLWRGRGLRCEAEQIIVVNGSQQALDLCARLLVDPGDTVVVENPGYLMARRVFTAAGAQVRSVPVDGEGLVTAGLQQLPAARLVYVTPSHQFPLGGVMSVARRQALLAWAGARGAYVVEDDYDSEYRFDTRPIETLQSLDTHGAVIYAGTFSKTLSPQLRLGYLVAPPALVPAFTALKQLSDRHTPSLEQSVLADFITNGGYERHVRRVRRLNAERRAVALEALHAGFGDRADAVGAAAGLHMVLWFRELLPQQETALLAHAAALGVGLHGIGGLFDAAAAAPAHAGIVLGYAGLELAQIRTGIDLLRRALDQTVAGRRGSV